MLTLYIILNSFFSCTWCKLHSSTFHRVGCDYAVTADWDGCGVTLDASSRFWKGSRCHLLLNLVDLPALHHYNRWYSYQHAFAASLASAQVSWWGVCECRFQYSPPPIGSVVHYQIWRPHLNSSDSEKLPIVTTPGCCFRGNISCGDMLVVIFLGMVQEALLAPAGCCLYAELCSTHGCCSSIRVVRGVRKIRFMSRHVECLILEAILTALLMKCPWARQLLEFQLCD